MSDLQNADIRFGESGEETLQDYRSVNRASIVGLILGLLSAVSLVHWLFSPIAIAAVAVSCLALVQIRARSGELVGRKAALSGIALGVFFATFATTREYVRRAELEHQARQHADQWLDLLRKGEVHDLYMAFELQKSYEDRQPAGTDLTLLYGKPGEFQEIELRTIDPDLKEAYLPQKSFNEFLGRPVVKEILKAGTDSELSFVKFAGMNHAGNSDILVLEYLLRYEKDNKSKSTRFSIKMARAYYDKLGEAHWRVVEIVPVTI